MVQVMILNKWLSKFGLKYENFTLIWWFSTNIFDNDLKCIMNSRNMEKKVKIVKVVKFMSKIKSSHLLLSILFNEVLKISSWYSTFQYLTQQYMSPWKIIQFKRHFATTSKHFTKTIMVFKYQSTFLVHFTMLAPSSWYILFARA